MFTCLNQHTNERLTSISKHWRGREGELRKLGRSDCLVCSYCKELVTFRSGEFKQPHFAHRQASKCPLKGKRSTEEIEAKAQLFEALEQIWDGEVRIDTILDGTTQPIDILLLQDGTPFSAYWIMSKTTRKFYEFIVPATQYKIPYHIIYTGAAHKYSEDLLFLEKQQRDQIHYNKLFDSSEYSKRGHLSFINIETSSLIIYRYLTCYHSPKAYRYDIIRNTLLENILIHPNGELITVDDLTHSEERMQQIHRTKEKAHSRAIAKKKSDTAHLKRQQDAKEPECIYCKTKTRQYTILMANSKCVCTPCVARHNQATKDNIN